MDIYHLTDGSGGSSSRMVGLCKTSNWTLFLFFATKELILNLL